MNRKLAHLVATIAALTFVVPAPALAAQPDQPATGGPTAVKAPPKPAPSPKVEWNPAWEGIRWWEYPTSVALMGFGFTARFALPDPDPNWRGGLGIEQDILDAIAVREDPGWSDLLVVSNVTFYGSMAYRAIDSIVIPGVLDHNWDVAWKMSWIDFESFSLVAAVEWGSQLFIGRVRPTANNCSDPTRQGHICDPNDSEYARSFIAGHPATAITAAGLTCLHHEHMPLYGGGAADDIACGVMIGNAVAGSVLRLMIENHYPSDLLFGVVLGLTAGWILPKSLHYGWGSHDQDEAQTASNADDDGSSVQLTVMPSAVDGGGGLLMLGRW